MQEFALRRLNSLELQSLPQANGEPLKRNEVKDRNGVQRNAGNERNVAASGEKGGSKKARRMRAIATYVGIAH